VHYECFLDVRAAIAREKQIKGWGRTKKIALITRGNPGWDDLSAEWFTCEPKVQRADPSLRSV